MGTLCPQHPVGAACSLPHSQGPSQLPLSPVALKLRPKGRRLNSVLPNDPGPAKTYCHSPYKESRQCRPPRPFPGLSFKVSSSVQSSPPVSRVPSTPRLPKSPVLTNLRKRAGGGDLTSFHRQTHFHTHKIIFLHSGGSSGSH